MFLNMISMNLGVKLDLFKVQVPDSLDLPKICQIGCNQK